MCPLWGSGPLGFSPEGWFLFSVDVIYVEMGNEGNPVVVVSSIILYIFVAYFSNASLLGSQRG